MDVGAGLAHGAMRAYVMGDRGARNEAATPEDIQEMGRLVAEARPAGAFGDSTWRTIVHRAVDGEPVPGTFAAMDECRPSPAPSPRAAAASSNGPRPGSPARTWSSRPRRWPGCTSCRSPPAVKLSALPCYSDEARPWADVMPYARRLFDLYGAGRLFWGSDLSRLPCPYADLVGFLRDDIPWLKGAELDEVMGEALAAWLQRQVEIRN